MILIKATSVGRFFLSSDCNSGENMQKLGLKEFLIAALYMTAIDSNLAEAADIFEYQGSSHRATGGAVDENGEVAFAGISAQDFEALSRRHMTLSFLKQLKSGVLRFYGTHIYGATVAPEDSPSAGFYEIEVYLLGASYKISPKSEKKKPKYRIRSKKRKRQKTNLDLTFV